MPTRVEFGRGAARRAGEEVKRAGGARALVISDGGVAGAGLLERVTKSLDDAFVPWKLFLDVEPNPKDRNVHRAAEDAREFGADCLVAVGGGSPIDCAKATSIVAAAGGRVRDYEGRFKAPVPPLPVIAVPTTAGTASEVTFGAVITDTAARFKFTVKSPLIAPAVALADPEMTATMPQNLTAFTGMDALTHAIEAYSCRVSTPFSDAPAIVAMELIGKYLRRAREDGSDMEAREGMLLGSLLAGVAFSHSDVASVHCLAEALGALYDAPHGACNAIALPAVMEFSMDEAVERYARVASCLGLKFNSPEEGARAAVEEVKQLARDLELPSLSAFGVRLEDFAEIGEKSEKNGSNPSNPKIMTKDDYVEILKKLTD
ncbi:MAG: iron-containing alcohol dehydrogenase [Synergistaceae bacterium]|nr:iron-containing alcohol dehydrogenase [Synergistaceae bacterium]